MQGWSKLRRSPLSPVPSFAGDGVAPADGQHLPLTKARFEGATGIPVADVREQEQTWRARIPLTIVRVLHLLPESRNKHRARYKSALWQRVQRRANTVGAPLLVLSAKSLS